MSDDDREPEQPVTSFTPVPVRHGNDGWTVNKQYAFIEAPAETGIVEDRHAQLVRGTSEHADGRRVGMSRTADNLAVTAKLSEVSRTGIA